MGNAQLGYEPTWRNGPQAWRQWIPKPNDSSLINNLTSAFEHSLAFRGIPCTHWAVRRFCKESPAKLVQTIRDWGGPWTILDSPQRSESRSSPRELLLEWPDGMLHILFPTLPEINTENGEEEACEDAIELRLVGSVLWGSALAQLLLTSTTSLSTAPSPSIHILAKSKYGDGLSVERLGPVGRPLQRGNYAPEVLEGYDHIIQDLQSDSPCGRLTLLIGPPGSGKTFALRGILHALHQIPMLKCVAVPANMTDRLGDPGIVGAFIGDGVTTGHPLVRHILFVEDADEALVARDSENMSTISALLNLTDGLVGQALDIRVIATTNAAKTDIDPAIVRPGRLCSLVNFRALTQDHARAIAAREGRPPLDPSKQYWTLSELYAWRKGREDTRPEGRAGFAIKEHQ